MKAGTIIRRKIDIGGGEDLVIDVIVKGDISPETPGKCAWIEVQALDKVIIATMKTTQSILELADCICAEVIEPGDQS